MKKITLKASAKINLSLIITGLMEDGYHELDTVMCPIELGDTISVYRRSDKIITCSGLDISDNTNTAVKAARLLMEEFDTDGVDIVIDKNIPIGAGLGGSSADAAGVLYAFSKLFFIDLDKIKFLARQIGSDISFLLQVNSGAMRARGRGDILTAEEVAPFDLVIAKPSEGVLTTDAYKLYDDMSNDSVSGDNIALVNAIRNNEDICDYLVNDLYLPAVKLNDNIEPLYKLMCKLNDNCAVMTGSGSAVVAICKNKDVAREVYNRIPDKYYKVITRTCLRAIKELDNL